MKLFKLSLITALSASTLLMAVPAVMAEEEEVGTLNTTTEGVITFIADDDYDGGEDPDNPDNPIDGNKGAFTINYVPDFDFGEHVITGRPEEIEATAAKVTSDGEELERAHFVQIRDNSGRRTGWTLKLRQTGQFYSAETTNELHGATITLKNPSIVNQNSVDGLSYKGGDGDYVLPINESIDLFTAEADRGIGHSTLMWGDASSLLEKDDRNVNPSVVLSIPADVEATTYTTEFEWSLESTPPTTDSTPE